MINRFFRSSCILHQQSSSSSSLRPGTLSSLASTITPASSSSSSSSSARTSSRSADLMADVIDDFAVEIESQQDPNTDPSLLKNLALNAYISPRSLSPTALLTPFPPRANLTLAYPLGIPAHLAPATDLFEFLQISPLSSPLNPVLVSGFVTTMGKIKPRGKTLLGRKNQRAVGKAVRRARSMGVIPTFGISEPTS